MIILGTRRFAIKKGITKDAYHCKRCGAYTKWEMRDLLDVFTIFFIPLIPYWKRGWLVCPSCESGIKITKENRSEMLENIEINKH